MPESDLFSAAAVGDFEIFIYSSISVKADDCFYISNHPLLMWDCQTEAGYVHWVTVKSLQK